MYYNIRKMHWDGTIASLGIIAYDCNTKIATHFGEIDCQHCSPLSQMVWSPDSGLQTLKPQWECVALDAGPVISIHYPTSGIARRNLVLSEMKQSVESHHIASCNSQLLHMRPFWPNFPNFGDLNVIIDCRHSLQESTFRVLARACAGLP